MRDGGGRAEEREAAQEQQGLVAVAPLDAAAVGKAELDGADDARQRPRAVRGADLGDHLDGCLGVPRERRVRGQL